MNEIKCGDTVVLNSGGPKMTVGKENDIGWYCTWFNAYSVNNYECFGESFKAEMLRLPCEGE